MGRFSMPPALVGRETSLVLRKNLAEARSICREAALDIGLAVLAESDSSLTLKVRRTMFALATRIGVGLKQGKSETHVHLWESSRPSPPGGQSAYVARVLASLRAHIERRAEAAVGEASHAAIMRRQRLTVRLLQLLIQSPSILAVPWVLVVVVGRDSVLTVGLALLLYFFFLGTVSPAAELARRRTVGVRTNWDRLIMGGGAIFTLALVVMAVLFILKIR